MGSLRKLLPGLGVAFLLVLLWIPIEIGSQTRTTSSGGVPAGTVGIDTLCLDQANQDACINYVAADILAQYRGTNEQRFEWYNTRTDGSNLERFALFFSSEVTELRNQASGSGTLRDISLGTGTDRAFLIDATDSAAVGFVQMVNAPGISASENYKTGLGVSIGTDTAHDVNVAAGAGQSFLQTHDIVFAAQAGKQLDVAWATGATAGMLGEIDAGPTATLTFSLTASPDTVTSDESTFANCNALTVETGTVIITGGSTNDGTYEVASCTDTVLTLGEAVLAGDETSTAGEYEVRYVKPDTWYHLFLIESAGTEDVCADTSEVAVNCLSESTYDQYRLLQSILTDATANILSF